ncbi:hypothetical protein NC653_036857 [Populus alba x Populus x berolinensis]|uniref:Uncharacterized protein n=1 Tax=Populus alba x Populus x berolinensis TaxID=444605 RepID=A0AAD6LMB2_9ROSI|nr:hypothetical protein NC653_036857 [Populus alba x Populus x berolinensis]
MSRSRGVLRKKEVMMVLCWEKPFSAKNGKVQVPWRKDNCPKNQRKSSYVFLTFKNAL